MFAPELILAVVPLAILFGLYYFSYRMIKQVKTNSKNKKKVDSSSYSTNLSNSEKNKIDKKLKSYFQDHLYLPVYDNISLVTKAGTYSSIEELYLTIADEKIVSLSEFASAYPSLYNKICDLLLAFAKQKDEVIGAEVKTEDIKTGSKLSDAQKYIDVISKLNKEIPNEEITNGLDQTCALLKQIDLTENTNKESKLTKLYDYYLPILTGVLENYTQLQKTDPDSSEFKEAETKLIKTIILINEALKTINEQLHEADYMNLSADMATLQSLLKKDGYVDSNPFGGSEDGD